jgi:hypothetical protein
MDRAGDLMKEPDGIAMTWLCAPRAGNAANGNGNEEMTQAMVTMRGLWAPVAIGMLAGLCLAPYPGAAQDTVADLRLVQDESGTPIEPAASPPGEKIYHLEKGVDSLLIGFDFTGSTPTDVEIRVMGPLGAMFYQETAQYDSPGPKVVRFDNDGAALEENEYVVNAYVGTDHYLADSLQLTVGQAVIATSVAGSSNSAIAPTPQQALIGGIPGAGDAAATLPGPSRSALLLAVVGMVALFGVVVWAGWSAMRRG